jgi:signal transduction histidine kinase
VTTRTRVVAVGSRAGELAETLPDGTYVVSEGSSAADALAELSDENADCILTAQDMGDAEDQLATIASETAVPILHIVEECSNAPSALAAGATDCIISPPATLLEARIGNLVEAVAHKRGEPMAKHRRQIERLHDVGVELAAAESQAAVYETMVRAAEDILDLDLCVADCVEDGRLVTQATSEDITEYQEPAIDSDEAGIAGKAYRNEESHLHQDLHDASEAAPAGEYRSGLTVPIGEYGVFQAVATAPGAFTETDLELVEILASHVREALRRLEHERKLRERREQLARENERLDEFTSIVSHDLRNPMNVAQLRLDLVREETDSEHVDSVQTALDRMETLLEESLQLARGGEMVAEFEPVELRRVVRAAWRNVQTDEATLEIETDVDVMANESRLQQLFENLFGNAVDHGLAGEAGAGRGRSALTIRVGTIDDEGFFVADDGEGIPEDIHEDLFEPGATTAAEGTGLGLSIVTRISQAHGWHIAATESADGGARFELTNVDIVEK